MLIANENKYCCALQGEDINSNVVALKPGAKQVSKSLTEECRLFMLKVCCQSCFLCCLVVT